MGERTSAVRSTQRGREPVLCTIVVVAVALLIATLVVSRRPDAVINPQFWAEDALWYQDAFDHGARALLLPWTGYFQTYSRATAALSLGLDLRVAPLLFSLAAILVQTLIPLLVLSSRFAGTMPDFRVRVLAALLLVGLPNAFEVQSTLTNTQTNLAILALLIVIADPPRTRACRIADVALVILAGVSGPTSVLLQPLAVLVWWQRRERWSLVMAAVLLLPASAQLFAYLTTGATARFSTPLGASPLLLLEIVGGQIFVAGTVGARGYARLLAAGDPLAGAVAAAAALGGGALLVRAVLLSRSLPLRIVVAFAVLALAAALSNPAIDRVPRWDALRLPDVGVRYYIPALVAYLATLLWGATADASVAGRTVARVLLALVLLIGMPLDWRVAARPQMGFADHAARYAAAPPGALVEIPIPPGNWALRLVKPGAPHDAGAQASR